MSEIRPGRGRLKWAPVSQIDALKYQEQGAQSPMHSPPPILEGMPRPWETYTPKQPITIKLQKLIAANAYAGAFESAISRVREQRIPEMDRIQNLYQFYFYVDSLVTWMPGLRAWEWQGDVYHERTDYLRLTQFYYFFNQPELVALQSPIDPVAGLELTPISLWLREFAVEWGSFLDTPASAKYLDSYKYGPEYAFQDYAGGPGGMDYKCFNDWFSRTFKNIDRQRPVASPDDPRVIAFPAESTYVGQWTVNSASPEPLPAESNIVVKHVEWPIPTLLQDSAYAHDFEGGILVHSFLNVFDYHRQHSPASGKILEAKFIPGQVYLDVELMHLTPEEKANTNDTLPNDVMATRYLNADDATGYQFVQCRGLMVLETAVGKIAVLPMGMAQVSAVAFVVPGTDQPIRLTPEEKMGLSYQQQVDLINERLQREVVGKTIQKGDMISTFLFGGSDIVVVFDRDANVNIVAQVGVHYPVRSQYAYSNITQLRSY